MKNRKAVIISVLILIGVATAALGLVLYRNYSTYASTPNLQDALSSIPSDCQFVFGMNVQKFVASPIYTKFKNSENRPIGKDLAEFIETTGMDPARDISFLVVGGRSGAKMKGEGVAIAVGNFDRNKITSYIRSKLSPAETTYGSESIMMIPEHKTDAVDKGIVFLDEQQIALGDLESLKAVLDVRGKGNQSILSNPAMGPLIGSIDANEMIWFAGDIAAAFAKTPVPTPLGPNISFIQKIAGTLNIGDAVVGKITAIAQDADSAIKLADVVRGFIAMGQLSGSRNPELKTMLSGLTVSQNANQVSLAVNFPAGILEKQVTDRKSQVPGL
jgi:hypothetical protein